MLHSLLILDSCDSSAIQHASNPMIFAILLLFLGCIPNALVLYNLIVRDLNFKKKVARGCLQDLE